MKPKANRQRRAGHQFFVVHPTGYIVHYGRARDGSWGAYPEGLRAACGARRLKQVKILVDEVIQMAQEDSAAEGWDMPAPQRQPLAVLLS